MPVAARPSYSTVGTGKTPTTHLPSKPAEVDAQYGLEDVDPIGRWEGIIVGRPGSGKTVLASTFPPPFRWMAADGQTALKSLRWAFKAGKTSLKNMSRDQLVAYTPYEDVPDGRYAIEANAFNKMTDMVDHWFSPGEIEKWAGGTIVYDSGSQINEWAMNLGLNVNGMYPSTDKPLSGSHKINVKAGLKIITGKQDYKSAMALFESHISDVRGMCAKHGCNLIILCHEWVDEEVSDEKRVVTAIKPALYGQLRDTLPKSFDDVWYMENYTKADGMEVKVRVHHDHTRDAKTRWGQCLNNEEPADYRYLISKVRDYHELSQEAFDKKYKKQVAKAAKKSEEEGSAIIAQA